MAGNESLSADDAPTRRSTPDDQETVRGLAAGQRVFGRFVLEGVAGRGGMGVVWRAHDTTLGETVALKFLPEVVARDAEAIDELKEETRRARRLTHPHIVRIHDFVQDERHAAVSMEFVTGRTLAQRRLDQPDKVFAAADLAPLVAQLCAALDYAHTEAKIVHRDLKPANLLVTDDGRLKVTDFGIARSLSETHTRLTGTGSSDTSGTLLYMSPQQLTGEPPTAADDIYSLGATLYDLLTGKPPFFTGGVAHQIQHKAPADMAARRAELGIAGEPIPPAWEQTIRACLAKDPTQRPPSAGEVAARLQSGVPAGPRRQPAAVRIENQAVGGKTDDRLIRRLRIGLWTVGLVTAISLAVGIWHYTTQQQEQQRLAANIDKVRETEMAAETARRGQERAANAERTAFDRAGILVASVTDAADDETIKRVNQALTEYVSQAPLPRATEIMRLWKERQVAVAGYREQRDRQDAARQAREAQAAHERQAAAPTVSSSGAGPAPVRPQQVETAAAGQPAGPTPAAAAPVAGPKIGQPYENILGMKFVPVPGTTVLFAVWETRVRDFAAFVRATGYDATSGMYSLHNGNWGQYGDSWKSPGFSQGETHPAVGLNEADAKAFCAWLTEQERSAGRLAPDQEYRLPTDAEWTAAAGPDEFPWGPQWPPPRGAGNYAGTEARDADWPANWDVIENYSDGFARTAPVGSFSPNRHGIYDLGGNVAERVGDRSGGLRGASFDRSSRGDLASSDRSVLVHRIGYVGIRCVLTLGSAP